MSHILQSITIVTPIIFVLALGFFAGKKQAFGKSSDSISVINELVLNFALPASLFVGTISVTRTQLLGDTGLFISLLISLLVAYFIGLFVAKYIFKRNMIEASIAGLAVSFSAGPFYGPALLDSIYGQAGGVSVSIIALLLNVFIVPLATIIIKLNVSSSNKKTSLTKMIGQSIFDAIFKTPFVWAPLLAFVLVFLDIHMPDIVTSSLKLIGEATAGIAIFVAGMTIAENKFKLTKEVVTIALLKNIGLPLLFVGVALFLHMTKGSTTFDQGLLLSALPSGPMIVLLATRYKQYQQEASSILAFSTVGMLVTVTAIIALLNV